MCGWREVWGHLGYQFSELRFRATLGVALVHKGGGLIFFRQDRYSADRELIIGQHAAQSLHHWCRGAQAAKSSPYCAYSPHLRSLCCAVHSGPPVQLFLYKKLQNSILQREREAGTNNGWEKETKGIKNSARTNSRCNARAAAEEKRLNGWESVIYMSHVRHMWPDILSANWPTVQTTHTGARSEDTGVMR